MFERGAPLRRLLNGGVPLVYEANYDPVEYVTLGLPKPVYEVFRRRWLSHRWNCDRIVAAALLHFLENAEPRSAMLGRLIEVVQGGEVIVPADDLSSLHRDAFFTAEAAGAPLPTPVEPFPEGQPPARDGDREADERLLAELAEMTIAEQRPLGLTPLVTRR
jgi:hypothetical protein